MKYTDLTIEFLVENMKKGRDIKEINIKESAIDEIKNLLEFNDFDMDDEEEKERYELLVSAIKKIKKENDIDCIYSIYENIFEFGDIDIENDSVYCAYMEYQKVKEEEQELLALAYEYMRIIKDLPEQEFEISFSQKSPSVYLKFEIPATKDNVYEFSNACIFGFDCDNVYEEIGYGEENIEVRLSDHDFGGFTKFDGYGDYVSYSKACINYYKRG